MWLHVSCSKHLVYSSDKYHSRHQLSLNTKSQQALTPVLLFFSIATVACVCTPVPTSDSFMTKPIISLKVLCQHSHTAYQINLYLSQTTHPTGSELCRIYRPTLKINQEICMHASKYGRFILNHLTVFKRACVATVEMGADQPRSMFTFYGSVTNNICHRIMTRL